MKASLLIIDDDEEIRSQMKWALTQDYEVILAEDRASALERFREQRPAVVLLDLGLPPRPADPEEGFAVLAQLQALDSLAKVIIITGQVEKENALRAIGEGAYDLLCKPVQMEELKVILKRAFYLVHLERDYRAMQKRLDGETFEGMLGISPQMQAVFASIRKVAVTDVPVLILGESGTGKEVAALALHRRSPRKEGPFVAINCGAIPETLLESELFGHEKGSFTGAHLQRQGRFETAAGGTLFLDEIGELSPPLQVKLLRFLQEKSIQRVGGRQAIQIDARVIAATNSDLKKAIGNGGFREDLYYRLAVVVLALPPLRDREKDVQFLASAFLRKFARENGRETLKFNAEALQALKQHDWPGNIRELENRVKRVVIMAEGPRVTPADLELSDAAAPPPGLSLKEAREALERDFILRALQRHEGKVSAAAADLGISRPTFYELLERLGIKRD